jgi:hypothetical protein
MLGAFLVFVLLGFLSLGEDKGGVPVKLVSLNGLDDSGEGSAGSAPATTSAKTIRNFWHRVSANTSRPSNGSIVSRKIALPSGLFISP